MTFSIAADGSFDFRISSISCFSRSVMLSLLPKTEQVFVFPIIHFILTFGKSNFNI